MPNSLLNINFSPPRNSRTDLEDYSKRMGLLGDQLRDPYSANNQWILRNLSSQFNASQPNYFEIAASQGLGGSIAGMQQAAAKRQAGLLADSNFGNLMNENQRTALGYYGQEGQTRSGLLNLDYQDKWREEELAEKKREYDDQSSGSFWEDLVNVGLGVAGSFAGGLGGSLGKKWFR